MQCSAARCQPACFSGRSAVPHCWDSSRDAQLCVKALARAAARRGRACASASGVRGSVHDFDRQSVAGSYDDPDPGDGNALGETEGQGSALTMEFRTQEARRRDARPQSDGQGLDPEPPSFLTSANASDELADASTFDKAAQVSPRSLNTDFELATACTCPLCIRDHASWSSEPRFCRASGVEGVQR